MRAARIKLASRFTLPPERWRSIVPASADYAAGRGRPSEMTGEQGGAEFGYHAAATKDLVRDSPMEDILRRSALEYHLRQPPGKISVTPTKGLVNQRDLALAYTPGVAAACNEIVRDPGQAAELTSRQNLVGVVTHGTAVLGLGAIGPLAAKPVMEGKSVLCKKVAGIDCFDIELDERDPAKLIEIIAALEPTFGAINLEDIKAPECFTIERALRTRMKIPVFHDDQHGTAITVGAAVYNGLKVVGKRIEEARFVAWGAGAAALACLELLVKLGMPRRNITVTDIKGVVYKGRREEMDPDKDLFAIETRARTLGEVITGADIFLGLSAGGVLKPEMVSKMAERPLILALANPEPEILPELAKKARPDCVIATGRSDYPNQVNNVLCFPFIFRGALDVGATTITTEMELAAVRAIAELAQAETSEQVALAYGIETISFGPEYIIPRPFDPRPRDYWTSYQQLAERRGVSPQYARIEMRRSTTLIGAMMIHKSEADSMICGTLGMFAEHMRYIDQVIGLRPGVRHYAAMNAIILPTRTLFICDTYVTNDPDAEHIAEMTLLAAEEVRRFGIVPKVALLSASNFGSVDTPSARKMRAALARITERAPDLQIEGEMHGDAALSEEIRLKVFPRTRLRGEANLLVMPTLDAANISFNLLKTASGGGVTIGPMLLGTAKPVHILTPSATVRRIVNMTALAVADANAPRAQESLF